MQHPWRILIHVVFGASLAACMPATIRTPVPSGTDTPAPVPGLIQETGTAGLTMTTEATQVDLLTPPDPISQQMVDLAKAHLAKVLGVSPEQISLVEVQPVVWRDASLGCPKPGIDYIRVETPGYRIVLESDGKIFDLHTDQTRRVVLCDRP